ncbi:MAG: PAS domain S-box protein, partial [Chloroflexota bacterium]
MRDITERRQAEEALRESEERYRSVVSALSEGIVLQAADGTIEASNASAEAILGLTLDQMAGRRPVDPRWHAVHEDGSPFPGRTHPAMATLATGEPCSGVIMGVHKPDGTLTWISTNSEPLFHAGESRPYAVVTSSADVTGLRRAAEEVEKSQADHRESERRLRMILETMSLVGVILDTDGRVTFCNDFLLDHTGWTRDDVLGRSWFDLFLPPDVREPVRRVFLETIATGEIPSHYENEIVTRQGARRLVAWSNTVLHDAAGRVVSVASIGEDVTDARRAEEELRSSRERYRALVENISAVIFTLDLQGTFTYVSPAIERLSGYTTDEVEGTPFSRFVHPDDRVGLTAAFAKTASGINAAHEFRVLDKTGAVRWVVTRSSLVSGSGIPPGITGVMSDITERKLAEQEQRESEARYRLLAEHTTDLVWLTDMNMRVTYQSPSSERLRGFTTQELFDLPLEANLAPESLRAVVELFGAELPRIMADPDYDPVITLELEYYRKDGTTVWSESRFSIVRDDEGRPVSILGEGRDITERRQAEEALRESEERYRRVSEAMADVAYSCTATESGVFEIDWMTGATEQITGRSTDDIRAMRCWRPLVVDEDLRVFDQHVAGLAPGQSDTCELRVRHADGTIHWLASAAECDGTPGVPDTLRLHGGLVDITERKQAEAALAGREEELSAILDVLPLGLTVVDGRGRIVRSNPALARELHLGAEEVAAGAFRERRFIRPDGTTMPPEEFASARAIATGAAVTDAEVGVVLEDGSTVWTSVSAAPVGEPGIGAVVVTQDITERKQAEAALARRGADLAEAQRIAHVGSWTWDPVTGVVTWSDEMFRIYGVEPGGPAPTFAEQERFYDAETTARINGAAARSLEAGTPFEVEGDLVRPDGVIRRLLARGEVARDKDGRITGIRGTSADITELRETQALLLQALKMETVGQLAGGIAHDFNNLLGVIVGNAGMMRMDLPPYDRRQVAVGEIEDAARRGSVLTRQLLSFSRKQAITPEVLDLDVVVGEIEALLRRLVGAGVDLRFEPGESVGRVRADRSQVGQVLMNLVVNARDAMPDGGTLTITTREVILAEADADRPPSLAPGRYVTVTVTDTGTGIDAATRAHLFEPFFTTKGPDVGTGLGLSTAQGIARQAGGDLLCVGSEPGHGSTFALYLPTTDDPL